MNFVLWATNSSAVIPFWTLFFMFVFWFVLSIPLTIIGALFGFHEKVSTLTVINVNLNVILFLYNGFTIY